MNLISVSRATQSACQKTKKATEESFGKCEDCTLTKLSTILAVAVLDS